MKGSAMKKEYIWLLAGIGIGIVAYPQIRKLPLVSKIPTV
jgi:hypothetical protein